MRITSRDARAVLEIVDHAARATAATPLPVDVVDELRRLFGADRAGYVEYRLGVPNLHDVEIPRVAVPDAVWQSFGEVLPTWVLRDHIGRRTSGFRSVSDVLTRTERRRNPFHRTVSAPLDVEDELKIWLPAPRGEARLLWFCRSKRRRDFLRREHDLAGVLADWLPHHRAEWERRHRPPLLSPRECEVLACVRRGLTNRQVAAELCISAGTVRKHLDHIYEKLDVHSRTAAAVATTASASPRSASGGRLDEAELVRPVRRLGA